jgi:hypothetical protein
MQALLGDKALQAAEISLDESASFNREKLQGLVKSLRSLINQSAASSVSETALNQMNSNLQYVVGEITSFISNGNAGHLANATNHADQNVLNYTWAFLPRPQQNLKADLGEIIDSVQERSRETIAELENQRRELEKRIAELASGVNSQNARLNELDETNARIKAESAASISNLETVFNRNQTERDNSFNALVNEAREALDDSIRKMESETLDLVETLKRHRDEAARIVQVVGDIGVTGNYQNIATKETSQADTWRRITMSLFVAGLAIAGFTFYKFYHEPVTPTNTLAIVVRLLYALAVAAPAFYTARESARHRTNADRAKQTELELASLGPFIELMKGEDKDEIRKSLIKSYFGRQIDPHEIKTILEAGAAK